MLIEEPKVQVCRLWKEKETQGPEHLGVRMEVGEGFVESLVELLELSSVKKRSGEALSS